MVIMEIFDHFINSKELSIFLFRLILVFFLSGALSFFSIPVILKISKKKNLMDIPGERSSHDTKIPNLGGIALFYSIGICAPIFAHELFETYKFLFASLVILLYIGIMDDIMDIKPHNKLFAQIIVAILMVVGSDVRLKNLFGLLGIYELTYVFSVLISIFAFIILINAFNLIDGIDGLAGTFSIISCVIYGLGYFHLGEYNYPMVSLCVIIIGALLGFLYYNLTNNPERKIFMGDTGSMSIGFLLVFTTFYFIDLFDYNDNPNIPNYYLATAPVLAFSAIIVPIIDTLSVIIIRLLNKQSPLKADKNHIHHKLLNLGLTHKQATCCIIAYYCMIIVTTYVLRHIDIHLLLGIVLTLGFFGAYLPNIILKLRKDKK